MSTPTPFEMDRLRVQGKPPLILICSVCKSNENLGSFVDFILVTGDCRNLPVLISWNPSCSVDQSVNEVYIMINELIATSFN